MGDRKLSVLRRIGVQGEMLRRAAIVTFTLAIIPIPAS